MSRDSRKITILKLDGQNITILSRDSRKITILKLDGQNITILSRDGLSITILSRDGRYKSPRLRPEWRSKHFLACSHILVL